MLVRSSSATALLERLEIHFLANPDPSLRFALLTDFADAAQETMPQDELLVSDALERVQALNQRYASDGRDIFFLFHRRRLWNAAEQLLDGLGTQARQAAGVQSAAARRRGTSYAVCSADPESLPRPQFVITLDADTQMTRDTARRLVGSLAHPLNRPRFDAAKARVVEGLRRAPAEGQLPPDGGDAFAVRRAPGGLGRNRSVLDGCFRCLHGPVRGRQLHRQGNLRRRCFRGGDGERRFPRTMFSATT